MRLARGKNSTQEIIVMCYVSPCWIDNSPISAKTRGSHESLSSSYHNFCITTQARREYQERAVFSNVYWVSHHLISVPHTSTVTCIVYTYLYAAHPITDVMERRHWRDVIHDEYTIRLAKIMPRETSVPSNHSSMATFSCLHTTITFIENKQPAVLILSVLSSGSAGGLEWTRQASRSAVS